MKVKHLDLSFKETKVVGRMPWFGPVLWEHGERPLYGNDSRLDMRFHFVSRRVER